MPARRAYQFRRALAFACLLASAASPPVMPASARRSGAPIQRPKPERTITVKLVPGRLPPEIRYRVTAQDVDSCTVWTTRPEYMLAAYHACEQRLGEGQPRTPPTPDRGLQCVPRDVLEVALTDDRQRVIVTLWTADGTIAEVRTQSPNDPLSTLWDR